MPIQRPQLLPLFPLSPLSPLLLFFLLFSAAPSRAADAKLDDPPIVRAVKSGSIKRLMRVLHDARDGGQLPAVVDERNENGATALSWAAHSGDLNMIDALLQSGATVDLANSRGYTPLMMACMHEHSAAALWLLRHGAAPDVVTSDSQSTALMFAAWKGLGEVVQELIQAGADMNLEDAHGHRAISIAEGEGHRDITMMIGRRSGLML
jgi:ankyrin repeat protein